MLFETWGATDDEAREPLAGDDLVANARLIATRAITIDAVTPAEFPLDGVTRLSRRPLAGPETSLRTLQEVVGHHSSKFTKRHFARKARRRLRQESAFPSAR